MVGQGGSLLFSQEFQLLAGATETGGARPKP